MTKDQLKKYLYCLMLCILAVTAAACCCGGDEPPPLPTSDECNATLQQQVEDFDTLYEGATISIEKYSDLQYFTAVGQVVNYTYTITNNSSNPFKTLLVQDDMISVSCPASQGLNANQSVTCTGVYTVTEDDFSAKEIRNNASAEATQKEKYTCYTSSIETLTRNVSFTTDAATSLTIKLDAHPEISLTKTVDPAFYSGGQQVTYTYTLTNTGNVPLIPPFSIDDDKVPSGWSCDQVSALQPNGTMFCNADYFIDAGIRWTIVNTAIACGYFGEQQVCSNSASASVLYRQPEPDPVSPSPTAICGNGIIEQGEDCDPPAEEFCTDICTYYAET